MDSLNIKNKLKEKKGFTLVEVVIGISILTIIFVGTFNALVSMGNVNDEANLKREVHSQIINIAEEIKNIIPSLSDETAPPFTKANALTAANSYQAKMGYPNFVHKGSSIYEVVVKTKKAKETQTINVVILNMSDTNIIKILSEERIYNLKADGTPEATFYPLPSEDEVLIWRND